MHAGNAAGSFTADLRAPCRTPFRNYVQTLLGLDSAKRGGASSAKQSSAGSRSSQWLQGPSNGWRPRRASDRLLQPQDASDLRPAPLKKSISVESGDPLADLRAEEHAGKWSSSGDAATNGKKDNSSSSGPDETSEEEFVTPSRTRISESSRPSPSSSMRKITPRRAASRGVRVDQKEDVMETQRDRWRRFRERKTRPTAVPHMRLKRPRPAPSEPIVLSSEEEDDGWRTAPGQVPQKSSSAPPSSQKSGSAPPSSQKSGSAPPSFLQLEFCSLHCGLMEADASGSMTITENGIILPIKGTDVTEVTVVASQLRGYGIWDGGVAEGGALLAGWEGPAPSLLFYWVSDAQANLLQRELSLIQQSTTAANAPSCSFLLVVLQQQLQDLQAALLASILDLEEYRQHRSSSSPIDWSHGLLMIHTCAPPVDQHLLCLLGHAAKSAPSSGTQRNSAGLQLLPTRLLQYPLVPCKGRITLTEEDLACLDAGEFLNDVIIDFYLKFLLLEGVSGTVAQGSHVFSSFFYKQLSRRRAAGESCAPSVPDRHTRHQRVRTWTRHVDIFTKDFLFVPVNQEAHWFLVVVCFPGLEDVRIEEFPGRAAGGAERAGELEPRTQQPPQCSLLGCQRTTVTKRPCILVMDSLKLSNHDDVCRLIRDYLQVEWEVRRKTPRLFTPDNMRSCSCRVPQQDNSSDCGLYLLQYAESFLQNPVVHFDLPLRLENWFPRQRVRQKRGEIRNLIMRLQLNQNQNQRVLP